MKTLFAFLLTCVALHAQSYTTKLLTNVVQQSFGPPKHTTNGIIRPTMTVTNRVLQVICEKQTNFMVLKRLGPIIPPLAVTNRAHP